MATWQLQQAKARLSELVDQAQLDRQFITWHGKRKAVVLSLTDYEKLLGLSADLKAHLHNFPDENFPEINRTVDPERETLI